MTIVLEILLIQNMYNTLNGFIFLKLLVTDKGRKPKTVISNKT
jgi:hypothetical protein